MTLFASLGQRRNVTEDTVGSTRAARTHGKGAEGSDLIHTTLAAISTTGAASRHGQESIMILRDEDPGGGT
jgi:hypothetical protein